MNRVWFLSRTEWGLVLAGLVTALGLGLALWLGQSPSPPPQPPQVTIFPAPANTPTAAVSPLATAAGEEALPGQVAVGRYVQISGTGGDGLRLRAAPGLDGTPLFLGFDGEVFAVRQGPEVADGYTWWFLTSPYDEGRSGWAAATYLEVISP